MAKPAFISPHRGIAIEDASAWILRGGLVLSVAVMITGLAFSYVHGHTSVAHMQSERFEYRPNVIWDGIRHGRGKSIIEAGIYLLLSTPILRVAVSAALFAFEQRDWFYTMVTAIVLVLVLAGLLWVG
ncbi:MAG: DUF1634 domain-containing protein [Tepidisphaeraceae bacterium]|jgi:uncharacterized membrane protein